MANAFATPPWRPTTLPPQLTVTTHGRYMRCGNPNCPQNVTDHRGRPSGTTVDHIAAEKLAAFASASGWIEADGGVYCGRTCWEIALRTKGQTQANRLDVARATPGPNVTRVSVRDFRNHEGKPAREIVCDHGQCPVRVRVSVDDAPDRLMSIAKSNGFQQAVHGTFCSGDCSKKERADILSGRSRPKVFPSVAMPGAPAPGPVAVAPPPAPAANEATIVQTDKSAPEQPKLLDLAESEHVAPAEQSVRRRGPRRG